MPNPIEQFTVVEVARRVDGQMIPVNSGFSFFCTTSFVDEDLKQYIHEPLGALPPGVLTALPPVGLLLTPYLAAGQGRSPALVCYERPDEDKRLPASEVLVDGRILLAVATSGVDAGEYHYTLFDAIAGQIIRNSPASFADGFGKLLREELDAQAHGDIRESSWDAKQDYLNRTTPNGKREQALWNAYRQQALRDTLTLYLHGICCDIDVEAGPRQLASRYVRRRLEYLQSQYPPPEGYAVFPEQVRRRK